MHLIRNRPVRTTQPQGVAKVDWSNPITRGLRAAVIGGELVEVVSGKLVGWTDPSAAGPKSITGQKGRSFYLRGNDAYDALAVLAAADVPTGDVTVVLKYVKTDTANRSSCAFSTIDSQVESQRFSAHLPWDDGTVYFDYGSASGVGRVSVGGLTFGDDIWVFRAGSIGQDIWQNGIVRASQYSSATSRSASDSRWGLGLIGSMDYALSSLLFLFTRVLSTAEIQSLTKNPWQVFEAPSSRTWVAATSTVVKDFSFAPNQAYEFFRLSKNGATRWTRDRRVGLAVSSSEELSASTIRERALASSIVEAQALTGGVKRSRALAASFSEVTSVVSSIKRARAFATSVAEGGAVTAALNRLKVLAAAVSEAQVVAAAVSRARRVSAAIGEAYAYAITLGGPGLKSFSAALSQLQTFAVQLVRARHLTAGVSEAQGVAATIGRRRSVLTAISEAQSVTTALGRVRQQVLQVNESQGVTAALKRLRGLTQAIANTTGFTFTVNVIRAGSEYAPDSLVVTVSWADWEQVNGAQRLVNRSETLTLNLKQGSTLAVTAALGAVLIVPSGSI